jgi:hypothetical protein
MWELPSSETGHSQNALLLYRLKMELGCMMFLLEAVWRQTEDVTVIRVRRITGLMFARMTLKIEL